MPQSLVSIAASAAAARGIEGGVAVAADRDAAYNAEQVEWLLSEARSIIHNLANEVAEGFVFDKGEPPQLAKANEVIAEINDMIGAPDAG